MRNLCKLLVVLGVMLALLFSVACGNDEADSGEMEKRCRSQDRGDGSSGYDFTSGHRA